MWRSLRVARVGSLLQSNAHQGAARCVGWGVHWRQGRRYTATQSRLEGKKKKQIDATIPSSPKDVDYLLAQAKQIEEQARLRSYPGFTGMMRSGLWFGAQVGTAVFCSAQAVDAFWSESLSAFWSEPFSAHLVAVISVTAVASTIGTGRAVAQETGRRLIEEKVFHHSINSMLQTTMATWDTENFDKLQKECASWMTKEGTLPPSAPPPESVKIATESKPLPLPLRFLQGRMASILLPNVYYVIKGVLDEFPQQQYDNLSAMEKKGLIQRVAVGVGNGVVLGQVDNVDSLGLLVAWGFAGLVVSLIAVRQYLRYNARSKYEATKNLLLHRSNGDERYLVALWSGMGSHKDRLQEKISQWRSKPTSDSTMEGDTANASLDGLSKPGVVQRCQEKLASLRDTTEKENLGAEAEEAPSVPTGRVRERMEAIKSVRVIPEKWSRRKDKSTDQVSE